MDINQIFGGLDRKVICFVGAGGKKTAMYAFCQCLEGKRLALSSTTHMYHYDTRYVDKLVCFESLGSLSKLNDEARVQAYFGREVGKGRVAGLPERVLRHIWDTGEHDIMLLKADGARARLIKAPADAEPIIPSFTDYVVPIFSIKVIGRKLDSSIAHRVELLSQVMGLKIGEYIRESNLVDLMVSEDGFLRRVEGKIVMPLINMVDSDVEEAIAVRIAEEALTLTCHYDSVIIGSMKNQKVKRIVRSA